MLSDSPVSWEEWLPWAIALLFATMMLLIAITLWSYWLPERRHP